MDQIRFNGRGISSNARPTAEAAASPEEGGVPLQVSFTGTATDPEGGALTYDWDFGDGSAHATTKDATHTYTQPGTYTARFTVRDAGGLEATDTVQVEATDCPSEPPSPDDEFDGTELDTCRWSEIVRDNPAGRAVADGALAIDTGNNTDMYGGNTNAQNVVLQPAPDGGWEATTKVDIALAEKTYEQASLMVYGSDQDFAKLSFIKVPDGRNLEFILQQDGQPVDGGAADRTPLLDANFPNTVWLRIKSDGTFLTASYSSNGTDFVPFGRARPVAAIPDPKVGVAAFNGDGDGDDARFDFFHLEDAGTGEPTCTTAAQPDPGYRMLFDNTQASLANWKMSGPGGFNLTPQCTLESFGGLGMLWYDELFEGPHTIKLEWMMPGDDNSGVFVGGWPDPGNDPFVAVNQGYEIQIDATDDADSTTGSIYNFQAPNAAARDQALNPPGQWNTYEITVDAPKVYVRLNGWLVNEFTSTDPARDLTKGHVGIQNHGTGDEVYFRDVQVKEHGKVGALPCSGPPTSGDDAFEGAAFDGCKWDRTVRYDPATLHQQGGALNVETSGGDIYGAGDTGPTNVVLQDAPAGDWTMETTVKVPLVKCCQQAGLIVHDSDDDYVKFDVIADEGSSQARFELRSETGDVVADPQNSEWLPYPDDDTYQLRLTRTGDTYAAAYRVTGGEWKTFGNTVTNTAVAGAPIGLFALGIFQDEPIYAAFQSFDVTGDAQPGAPTVQGFADPGSGTAPLEVQFSATGQDPDGGALRYRWEFGDGSSAFGAQPVHTYTAAGEYEATVTVTDDEGDTATDTVPVTVTEAGNRPPTVDVAADPVSGRGPLEVHFEAVGHDPEGGPLTYEWDFGDGGGQFGGVVDHTYLAAGTYTAEVTATDAAGATDTATIAITVQDPPANQAPTVRAAADPKSGPAPLRVRLSSAPMDMEDGRNLLVVWDFGDGGRGGGDALWHTYTTPGTYSAKVTVTDRGGKSASTTVTVTVTGASGVQSLPPVEAPRAGDVAGESETRAGVRVAQTQRLGRVARRGLRYTVACDSACRVTSILRAGHRRLGRIAGARVSAGASRRLVLRLDRSARRRLSGARRVRATLVTTIRSADGTRTVRTRVVLRR
jgi:PKD repeat protein